jgi:glycosyltransferase involved in cell wall biosynthesis
MVKASTGLPVFATTCGDDILTIPSLRYGIRLSPYYEAMVRDNMRRVDAVGSLSSAIRQELESLGGTARIFDIPNGVDWESFQTGTRGWLQKRLNLGENSLILVSLGRLNEMKGYPTGLRAFSLAASQIQNLHYVIAGAGTNALEGLVCELNLKGRVHLLGSVPMKDIPHLLRSADLFLSPSLSEGFSQAVVQALCCGLPCVVSDCSGNEDLDGRPGVLMAKAQDPASMAKAIEVIALNRPLRLRMSQEAQSWSRRYAWSEISEAYLRIFRELAPSAAF